jgi:hypothetical protein
MNVYMDPSLLDVAGVLEVLADLQLRDAARAGSQQGGSAESGGR